MICLLDWGVVRLGWLLLPFFTAVIRAFSEVSAFPGV